VKASLQIQPFFYDRYEHIDRDGNPNLGTDRVGRGAIESFDPQMLLDPTKEQFHFPAALIKFGDTERGKKKVVGQKHQPLVIDGVVVTDAAKPLGVATFGHRVVERHDLIALKSGGFVDRLRIKPPTVEAFFCPRHEEGSRLVQSVESSKVEITSIHKVNGTRFPEKLVEDIDLVNLSAGDDDHGGDTATKIQQRMQFDRGFLSAKLRPGKKRQTQIDGSGVQRINGLFQFEAKGFVAVEIAR